MDSDGMLVPSGIRIRAATMGDHFERGTVPFSRKSPGVFVSRGRNKCQIYLWHHELRH